MHWSVKYEPFTRKLPWSVYKNFENERIFQKGFLSEEEAQEWVSKKEKLQERPDNEKTSRVDESSIESFPASGPPAWTKTTAGPGPCKTGNEPECKSAQKSAR